MMEPHRRTGFVSYGVLRRTFVLFRTISMGVCSPLAAVNAQATFYQVPTGDIAKPADVYFQQQSTLSDRLDLSLQGMVGLGSNFDAGMSVYNFDFVRRGGAIHVEANHSDRGDPFGPLVLGTVQKRFDTSLDFAVVLGGQAGPNVGPVADIRMSARGYANVVVEWGENRRCSAGAYLTNGIFVGGRALQVGPWLGCDIEVLEDLLEIQADWDFGNHANGAATFGPQLRVTKQVGVALGLRVPNPWADNAKWGGVLQIEVKDPLSH
jgi:hypothetical protein